MIEDILIEPVHGDFDLVEVEAYVTAMPYTVRDTVSTSIFMVAEDASDLARAIDARTQDPERFPIYITLVDLGGRRIDISCRMSYAEPARAFVEWLRTRYDVRFMDETFKDVTAQCRTSLDYLFA